MKAIIAEKPRMAQAIANALNVPKSTVRGVYQNQEFCVLSCQGHLLTEYEPHDYDHALKKWTLASLPIIPGVWKVKPIVGKEPHIKIIEKALESCSIVYAAGDPDAAGQRIVDEVLSYVGWKGGVLRPLISDLNPEPIQKAIAAAESNEKEKYRGLYRKELCRARGDWLIGMNLTRLYTTLGNKLGLDLVLSAGRVQSATLGLVVGRDLEIRNFKPHDYFSVKAAVSSSDEMFVCVWTPNEHQEGLDSNGRLISHSVAEKLTSSAPCTGEVVHFSENASKESAPLAYSMSELQKHASKRFGMTMKVVLDAVQSLYDKHELVTYPRSDTGYLPESHHSEAPVVLSTISRNLANFSDLISECDCSIKSRAFNTGKVTAHHAIIPTQKSVGDVYRLLNEVELKIYEMICIRYAMQFMEDAQFVLRSVTIETSRGDRYKAADKRYLSLGWRLLESSEPLEDVVEENSSAIPLLAMGDSVDIVGVNIEEKVTKPPKHHTDASLLDAMTNIHRHVTDKEIAASLKEGEGIGTEATRADIVEKLVQHQLISRNGKKILSTEEGRLHCSLMPDDLTSPDMAGLFECITRQVETGDVTEDQFLQFIGKFVALQVESSSQWLENARVAGIADNLPKCRACGSHVKQRQTKADNRKIWVCSDCDSIYMNESGAVGYCIKGELRESDLAERETRLKERLKAAPPCPRCNHPILKERSKSKKMYWSCRGCHSCFLDMAGEIGPAYIVDGERREIQADGPQCTHCQSPMHRRMTKKKTPIFICNECDSMAWSDNGKLGQYFKINGEMQNSRRKMASKETG